jgi:hypothetical protein
MNSWLPYKLGMVAHAYYLAFRRQEDFEFKTSLVYPVKEYPTPAPKKVNDLETKETT